MPFIDNTLDDIYYVCDNLMRDGDIKTLDSMLEKACDRYVHNEYDLDIALGYLTATLPVRTKLKSRDKLYNLVSIHPEVIEDTNLLRGL